MKSFACVAIGGCGGATNKLARLIGANLRLLSSSGGRPPTNARDKANASKRPVAILLSSFRRLQGT